MGFIKFELNHSTKLKPIQKAKTEGWGVGFELGVRL